MLPSVPKSLGRLSDVYLSAYLALSTSENPLKLAARKSYLVILVDGLGVANIKSAGGHASFLNQKLRSAKSLFSGFPATTTTSLTSMATGVSNGNHAVLDRANLRTGFLGFRSSLYCSNCFLGVSFWLFGWVIAGNNFD
jgi:hypothetical protein